MCVKCDSWIGYIHSTIGNNLAKHICRWCGLPILKVSFQNFTFTSSDSGFFLFICRLFKVTHKLNSLDKWDIYNTPLPSNAWVYHRTEDKVIVRIRDGRQIQKTEYLLGKTTFLLIDFTTAVTYAEDLNRIKIVKM